MHFGSADEKNQSHHLAIEWLDYGQLDVCETARCSRHFSRPHRDNSGKVCLGTWQPSINLHFHAHNRDKLAPFYDLARSWFASIVEPVEDKALKILPSLHQSQLQLRHKYATLAIPNLIRVIWVSPALLRMLILVMNYEYSRIPYRDSYL
jgi:hypothetical protein